MSPVVLHPDLEEILTGFLHAELEPRFPGITISNQYGGQQTAVWLRRDNGRRLDSLRSLTTLGVNCFAPTRHDVSSLARLVIGLLVSAPNGLPIVRVEHTSGPQPIEDKIPREYLTVDVTTRGTQQ